MATYQADATLTALLGERPLKASSYAADLVERSRGAAVGEFAHRLRDAIPIDADAHAAVPTHGDPNASNFIVPRRHPYVVDWDDAALADPMRDIGQILWWYVPPAQWPHTLDRWHLELDDALEHRLHWWVAAESLDVALRLSADGHHADAEAFATDARAALEHRPNPRA